MALKGKQKVNWWRVLQRQSSQNFDWNLVSGSEVPKTDPILCRQKPLHFGRMSTPPPGRLNFHEEPTFAAGKWFHPDGLKLGWKEVCSPHWIFIPFRKAATVLRSALWFWWLFWHSKLLLHILIQEIFERASWTNRLKLYWSQIFPIRPQGIQEVDHEKIKKWCLKWVLQLLEVLHSGTLPSQWKWWKKK